jgi:spore coat polysaccharide biosynthesis protein SpsF
LYTEVVSTGVSYLSNMLEPSYPLGMAIEVIAASALLEAQERSTDSVEREHVTPYIYRRPHSFKLHSQKLARDLSAYRCTVDTPEDFELVTKVFEEIYLSNPDYTFLDVVSALDAHPEWQEINRRIVQVKV